MSDKGCVLLRRNANRKHRLGEVILETTSRRQRNHRLITRGAAMESVFPDVKPLTEREFYEMAERISVLPGIFPIIEEAVTQHHTHEKLEAG